MLDPFAMTVEDHWAYRKERLHVLEVIIVDSINLELILIRYDCFYQDAELNANPLPDLLGQTYHRCSSALTSHPFCSLAAFVYSFGPTSLVPIIYAINLGSPDSSYLASHSHPEYLWQVSHFL